MQVAISIVVGVSVGGLAGGRVGRRNLVDLAVGTAGGVLGGWGFGALAWATPRSGLTAQILVAAVGAVAALLVLQLVRDRRWTPS